MKRISTNDEPQRGKKKGSRKVHLPDEAHLELENNRKVERDREDDARRCHSLARIPVHLFVVYSSINTID